MKEKELKWTVPSLPKEDSFDARQYRRGFTLVPCWIVREDGQRVHGCKWVKIALRA